MKLPVVNSLGAEVRQIDVDDAVFGITPNLAVVHQTLLAQRANARQGNHNTQNRSDWTGSTAKSRKQKGSGHARLGAGSSPVRKGGAVAHGPHPHSHRQRLPKRMRRLAIRSMLSQRAAEGGIRVLEIDAFDAKTRSMRALLGALGVERSALVVTDGADSLLQRSIRNLPGMDALAAHTLNVEAMLTHDDLILTETAVRCIEALWGGDQAIQRGRTAAAGEGA